MNRSSIYESADVVVPNRENGGNRQIPITLKQVAFADLPRDVLDTWIRWCKQPEFYSPYFHPEFAGCVSQVRNDVGVLLGYRENELVAIFPFQRCGRQTIEPVGGAINDYHGVICNRQSPLQLTELLRTSEFQQLKFHSWVRPDESMLPYVYGEVDATIADFSNSADAFLSELRRKSRTIRRHPQKTRKLMREIGPIHLEFDCRDPEVLQWTMRKKRERYLRTGVIDFFGVDWTRNLIRKIFETRTENFGGQLSALYAGGRLIAAHFGMRRNSMLHYWYPVYDLDCKIYSPGTQLFLEIVKHSEEQGINMIDFGYGQDQYKEKLTNRSFRVYRGCVDFNPLRSNYKKTMDQLVCKVKSSRIKQPIKRLVRMIAPGAGQPRV